MNVLSLFDGISCGMVALERAGIMVDKYYASEIDENAIKISKKNYPNIIHLGDITKWNEWNLNWNEIDLLIGGSPCQDLCSMGSRQGLSGSKSWLFYVYVEILNHIKLHNKDVKFLLENNFSMTTENKDKITECLGVCPVFINSADFSAQNRKRLYWANFHIDKWECKNISIKDIFQRNEQNNITDVVKNYMLPEWSGRKTQKNIKRNIKTLNEKSGCISANCGGIANNATLIIFDNNNYYLISPIEAERLQTLPDNYTEGITKNKRLYAIGNGWTVDVIAHIFKSLKNV